TVHLSDMSPSPDSPNARHLLARLRLEQARFLFGLGRYERIPEYTGVAISLAAAGRDILVESQANLVRGYVPLYQGEWHLAQASFERALSLAQAGLGSSPPVKDRRRISLREVEANSLNGLAMVSKRLGRSAEAEHYLEASLQAAREADDLAGQSRALNGRGMMALRRGDFSTALAHSQEALGCTQACGDRRIEGALFNNLGNIYLRLGVYEKAIAHYQKALDIQREIGARQKEMVARFNLGLAHHYQGDREMARRRVQQALDIARAVGDRRAEGLAWTGLGHVLLGLGRLDKARAAYQKSIALRRELGQTHLVAEPLTGLARICLERGETGRAQVHVEEILAHIESGGALEGAISPFQMYLTCTHALAAGRDSRASAVLATAHDLLQERAVKITDKEQRRSFLENVAAHRELVQTFERMGGKE
ncbi:MAG: tetratricopeptide repeat protein, partial [Anaerolineae bacterium]